MLCVFSSHSFWTSSSLDVPAGVTQEEGHTEFLIHPLSAVRALIFLARRIQPFLSLVDREVEFWVLTIQSFSTRWTFLLCTQYYGPIYNVFLRPNCVLLLFTYRRLDANVLPTFTMLRPFVGLVVRICSREWF